MLYSEELQEPQKGGAGVQQENAWVAVSPSVASALLT